MMRLRRFLLIGVSVVFLGTSCYQVDESQTGAHGNAVDAVQPSSITGAPGEGATAESTQPADEGTIRIRDVGTFSFEATEIETLRPDIFQPGHFSVFDILAHLNEKGGIDLDYRFDESMETHVIRSLNGERWWWYRIYYEGGWPENNVHRMDHFPYKERATITVYREREDEMRSYYALFREETARFEAGNEKVVVPRVTIQSYGSRHSFENVAVTAHDLRTDALQPDTVTALDVILSLGDQDKISYDVRWVETIGYATVQNYFVHRIDEDAQRGRCGFVYEAGPEKYRGFHGNHIHLASDMRVIRAPDYVLFFWICV
ncbi:MAG: hypothetical protein GVY29_02015 [Spirochaetes bacterium]|jgi:hypothetical protein|nr:hypothetical protein [Spirochaetota bacterium]